MALGLDFVGFEVDAGYFSEARRLIEAFDPTVDGGDSSQLALF